MANQFKAGYVQADGKVKMIASGGEVFVNDAIAKGQAQHPDREYVKRETPDGELGLPRDWVAN
ncbi:hypothetical protein SEA_APIARY_69 [Rhodococcus phage Apiary]|nr:hypothetical protein SEA_BRAXOADDIE_69 [Rhodococcus phage Braxoaddie]WNM64992.1 hypothetical protein SEA_MASELOP_69 [Rhodococcus phage Maselop]WNM67453.1 hypothetical protein SEA_POLYYUKI_69 [Rhodococcus phage Polyyuki]WNM69877.1 hypothetical protein SEA_APIARY_69 [Rhodococcus phage Apiary]